MPSETLRSEERNKSVSQPTLEQGVHPSFLNILIQKKSIKEKTAGIKHRIGVYSAKGGVGKTTVAVNLAYTLSKMNFSVGLLDADIDCPNVTLFTGTNDVVLQEYPLKPLVKDGVKIMSTALFIEDKEKPIIWRGPMKSKMLRDFFESTSWGDLDYLIIDLPPGCVPGNTFILMRNNYPKTIDKIKSGEFVLSYDKGKLVENKVINVVPQGMQKVFRLKTPNRTILASANHPFLKYNRNLYWKELCQLEIGDRIVVANCIKEGKPLTLPNFTDSKYNMATHVTLPKVTDTNFMQIIGHFIGDGYIRINKTKNKIIRIIICKPSGSKFRKKYEELYQKMFKCHIYKDGDSQFEIASLPIVKLFQHLDLYHSALEKRVPEWVFSLPVDQRRAFIQGYSEAAGLIRHQELIKTLPNSGGQLRQVKLINDVVALESTNALLIKQMHELCQISGIRSQNVRSRNRPGNIFPDGHKTEPSTTYSFEYSLKFDNSQFKIARVKSIEPAGYEQTYDLQLEKEPHNFIANNMIVHNTSDTPLSIMQLLELDGIVFVTTPQTIAAQNTIRSGYMAKRMNIRILGVIETMSDGVHTGVERVAKTLDTKVLGSIKYDDKFNKYSDSGKVPVLEDSAMRDNFEAVAKKIISQ